MSRRHEQLLFRYSSALERGDFETVADVLRDAERDPALEQMILDMNAAYSADSSVNHKNPKEVPMIAALYLRRPPARDQWQSLPLITALVVIGLLVAMIALQTRLNKDLGTGQGGSPVPAVAQNNSICQGTSRETAQLYSHPSTTSVVVGTLPSQTPIRVLDEQLASDGDKWILWFFAAADNVQGWVLSDAVVGSGCPQVQENFVPPAITAQQSVMTLVPSYASATPPHADIAVTALPTFVPSTSDQSAVANAVTTACPASNAGARITMYSRPSLDAYKFSQSYDATQYAFFLLDSTEVDGQTWYYVRIDSAVDEKQGWISGDDYSTIKDCAPWNAALAQAVAIPSDLAIPTAIVPNATSGDTAQVPEAQAFTLVQPTLIPADASPSPVPAGAMFILDTCRFDLTKAVALYAEPSNDARAIDFLHQGTIVQVSEPSPLWYWVTAYYSDGMTSSTGFVRTDMLTLPDDCHLTPAGNTSVIPATLVPADGVPIPNLSVAIPAVQGIVSANAATLYTLYVVQPGDTLYSILLRFKLDMSAMPELMFINNLPQNPVLSEEMTLLIPTANNAQPLICVIGSQKTVELHTQPSTGGAVILSLHTGSVFSVTDQSIQSDGTWYGVTAQISSAVISGVWVSPDTISVSADCQRFASAGVVTLSQATVMPPATATPVR